MNSRALVVSVLVVTSLPCPSRADGVAAPPLTLGGSVETYYQWNGNDPSNHITHARGFDNRSDTFTLSNVTLDARWDDEAVIGRLTLQVGSTPATYFLSEPVRPGTPSVAPSGPELWRHVQQALAGYRFGNGRQLSLTAGLFVSPVGPETLPVRENWHWSRSNLFFGLPFYHAGVRAAWTPTPAWTITTMLCNGWNSVVDNNASPSLSVEAVRAEGTRKTSLLYFGGIERPIGAPEGQPWRHLLDAYQQWSPHPRLDLLVHADLGAERGTFGTSLWMAGAVMGRWTVTPRWSAAGRIDGFRESTPSNAQGRASPIFWPVPWVASTTATLDHRPVDRVSLRLEWRHDQAGGDLYFGGTVAGDGVGAPFVPNRSAQDTLTVGMTTWM